MVLAAFFQILSGLVCFLMGMQLLSNSLELLVTSRMKQFIKTKARGQVPGFFIGLVVTMLVQSSSATTVITISLLDSGLLSLVTAFGLIAGANVGTTITAQIIAFDIGKIAPLFMVIGLFLYVILSGKRRYVGLGCLGFGLLFFGLDIISSSFSFLKTSPSVWKLLSVTACNYPLAIVSGAVFSAIIQSSSAAMGVIIILAKDGLVSLPSGILLAAGTNVGTCITAFIALLGRGISARRGAFFHFIFNISGVLLLILILPVFVWAVSNTANEVERQIANAHTLFNLITAGLTMIYSNDILRFVEFILPNRKK